MREVHRQGGLAYPSGPADHHGRPRLTRGELDQVGEHVQLRCPAGETCRTARELSRHRRNEDLPAGPGYPDRHGQPGPRLGRRDQQRPLWCGQFESIGQLSH
jgi:hypothetical protein